MTNRKSLYQTMGELAVGQVAWIECADADKQARTQVSACSRTRYPKGMQGAVFVTEKAVATSSGLKIRHLVRVERTQ